MSIFISVETTVECILAAVIFTALFTLTFKKPAGILQASGYKGRRLFGWAKKKGNAIIMRHTLLAMLCALSYAVIALCFSFLGKWAAVCGLAMYALFFILYAVADNKIALRSPAVFTPRLKRLYAVTGFITAVFVYLSVTLLNFADAVWGNNIFTLLKYCPLAVYPLLTLPLIALGNLVAGVYEKPHNKALVRKAAAKLKSSKIKVVGITGSYGKTGTKQILSQMLAGSYRVLSTPRSHNTPLGLALCINGNALENYDIFIAEMGARHVGDIAELCRLCPPDYSVITGICNQHLESFGSEQNIITAKGEILAATKNCAVISPDCYEYFKDVSVKKVCADCVKDIVCTCSGTDFTLCLGGEEARVHTVLLGEHSAKNIGVAAQTACLLGVPFKDICAAAEKLNYIEHRLQLIKSGGINILDDGYNSNVRGAEAALGVLRLFGGRKIAVTPGLVELGVLEEAENYALGKKLVGLDLVILVGDTLITPVKNGYLQNGGDGGKLIISPTLASAQEKLKGFLADGDTVLFLNDLPDIY